MKNKAMLQKLSMNIFESHGYEASLEVFDELVDKLDYDPDIFVEYCRDIYESFKNAECN